jgi:asparagine synthase (glutamine-hydrolysing)
MCGIVGVLNFKEKPVEPELIKNLTNLISHRGPDGDGQEVRGSAGIGHRRLSIIDPALGHQPMFNEDRSIAITFNGEIYNYKEIRIELLARGHRFTTHSDTEVIIHAYEEWKEKCVERFRGMFAFGIVDFKNRVLFVARDHFGIKPLYYLANNDLFAFCSEFHPLTKIPGIDLSLDLAAIDEYLWLQYIPAPKTAVLEIQKLLPAHRITIGFNGQTSGPECYWSHSFKPNYNRSQSELVETLDELLEDSVRAHLVSDVPFGVFLSGGVDSSLVLAYMSKILKRPVEAFSIGFEDAEFDETGYATTAAKLFGAEHHVEKVTPDALGMLPSLVRHYGEPFGDSSAVATYYVSQMARRKVPMVLTGDGADESFAGYWSHRDFLTRYANPDSRVGSDYSITNVTSPYPKLTQHDPSLGDWLDFVNYLPTPHRMALWKDDYKSFCPGPIEVFREEFQKTAGYSLAHRVQYIDQKTYLPYDILTKVDIASMMNGLETRTPFVDLRIFEFAATIPERYSIGIGPSGEWETKLLLKKVAEKYFPKDFIYRPKKGFAIPVAKWFSTTGKLHGELRERLTAKDNRISELFNLNVVGELLDHNMTGQAWLLLVLDEWMKQNL